MLFGDVCRKLRAKGFTNLWSLAIWDKKPPITMDEQYIARNASRSVEHGDWDIVDGNVVVFVRKSDGERLRIYSAA